MSRLGRTWGHVRRAARNLRFAARALVEKPRENTGPSTANWHRVEPSHPSLLCKCGVDVGPDGHDAVCPWLAAMCKTCHGEGWCPRCRGDGCEPSDEHAEMRDAEAEREAAIGGCPNNECQIRGVCTRPTACRSGDALAAGRAATPPNARDVVYVAHPLGSPDRAGLEANLARAMRWLSWLRRSFPGTTFIAPWIAAVLSGEDDADPQQREAGLVDADAVIPLLAGLVLVGGRVSSGMARELGKARRAWDLTSLGDEPPAVGDCGRLPFAYWAQVYEVKRCAPADEDPWDSLQTVRIERDEAWAERDALRAEIERARRAVAFLAEGTPVDGIEEWLRTGEGDPLAEIRRRSGGPGAVPTKADGCDGPRRFRCFVCSRRKENVRATLRVLSGMYADGWAACDEHRGDAILRALEPLGDNATSYDYTVRAFRVSGGRDGDPVMESRPIWEARKPLAQSVSARKSE